MRKSIRKLSPYLMLAALAVAGLAAASVVILNPAELKGQVSFSEETVTHFRVDAFSWDGPQAGQSFTTNTYSLTVESGYSYIPSVTAYLSNPTVEESTLTVSRVDAVMVDNQVGPTTVDFNYPDTQHIQFSLGVNGGTLSNYSISASARSPTDNHSGTSSQTFSGPQPASASGWVAVVPQAQVQVQGFVELTTANGLQVSRTLGTKSLSLLEGEDTVSWEIDLVNTGQLSGVIQVSPSARVDHHIVYFTGAYGTPAFGTNGMVEVPANGTYGIDLPPGGYHVYLMTYLKSPYQTFDTKSYQVTLTAGATTTLDFTEPLGTAQVSLSMSGVFSNAWLLRQPDLRLELDTPPGPGFPASAWSPEQAGGQYSFLLPSGKWKRREVYLSFRDASNPQVPLRSSFSRQYDNDSSIPSVPVSPGTTVSLGTESLTFVKSTVWLDVREATPGEPETLLRSPQVWLHRSEYNGDGSDKRNTSIQAFGSSESRSTSALAFVAEPGTYRMEPSAFVNGAWTQFATQYITVAPPAQTGAGTNVSVVPVENAELKVEVTFPEVTSGGLTTVTESPLGPEPPQGLKTFCADGASSEGIECSPLFYDIETTAQFTSATVCIRRKLQGTNGLATFLRLYHFNKDLPPAGQWEELPPPPGMEPAIDCAADLAACGCADEASCGIDYNADPPVSVVMVCGVTQSFSPFAVFEKDLEFTNTVNGQQYEGPTGPPTPQTWTVPVTGTYRITAIGAGGAAATQTPSLAGGCGARISGEFTLQGGDTLQLLVGQKGTATQYSGGGGGGSFVTLNGTPLVIAGGGGGVRSGATVHGRHGSAGTAGVAGSVSAAYTSGFVAGGTGGQGGARVSGYGSGGGGWSGNGAADGNYGEGGFSFLTGAKGGAGKSCGALAHGGYGGGGAGNGCYGGGGGGGYSGGGGGRVGGGGGSWNAGARPTSAEGVCTPNGHGRVMVSFAHP
jgi:hypothetical protein